MTKMQATGWISLLQRVPAGQQDNLILVSTTGTEFAIQQIVRMEEEYLVIRGRLAGSQDTGRAFFIPYDQINYVCFLRPVTEEALHALFDEAPPTVPGTPMEEALAPSEPAAAQEKEPEPPAPGTPAPGGAEAEPAKPVLANKAALLERLRARTRGDGAKPAEK